MADSNSLGLDFDKETSTEQATTDQTPNTPEHEAKPEKKKPYVNPERVKTGGPQREKLSEEELAERMQRMKEQNEKIKQRRQDVKADEDAFRKMQEAERVKQAQTRKVQEGIDRTREQNARRKMEKMQSREWDSGKPTDGPKPAKEGDAGQHEGKPARGGVRGGPRGRGRGRGNPSRSFIASDSRSTPTTAEEAATTTTTASEKEAETNDIISSMGRGVLLTANLPQLQNLIKRDPAGYKEEFLQQYNHYNSIRQLFVINPDENATHLRELVTFISQVAVCYPKETKEFPTHLSALLLENYGALAPDTRKTLIQNLVILRNKNVISSIDLLKSLFPVLPRTTSSSLRTFIRKTILSDIRTANLRAKNHKLNRAVQAMLFAMIERGMDADVLGDKGKLCASSAPGANGEDAMWAVILTKELWRKGVWTDTKTVSIVALGCFHPVIKVQSASLHFFLSSDDKEDSDDESDQEVDVKALHHRREINKKTRSADKKLQKQLTSAKKKMNKISESSNPNFAALQLLNDPQSFAERLYDNFNRYDKRFSLDHKILRMQLLSRVMGSHKLFVLPFYTYILKYLTYRQLRVPAILVALAQSVHDLTPPDVLTPVVKKLAAEFVHPGVGSEVIAAGINAIREVCRRQPWAMQEDLLGDLVEYRKSRDKAVTAAARGILQLYREVNPGMLKRRERGKDASIGMGNGRQPLPFGHSADAAVDIEGLSLLEEHLKKLREEETGEMEEDDEAGWEDWDLETDSSESNSEGWMDVSSDGEDLEVSDSEDEKETSSAQAIDKAQSASEGDKDDTQADESRPSTLATTKILTPADFAILDDLRIKAAAKAVENGGGSKAKRKLATLEAAKKAAAADGSVDAFISENDILGPRKKIKASYAERVASIEKGREGREKYGSLKGKKRKETASSSTNREKARNKPIMMILSSGAVRGKKKASLREKQQKLRAHIERSKKAHH